MNNALNTLAGVLLFIYFAVAFGIVIAGFALAATWPVWIWFIG